MQEIEQGPALDTVMIAGLQKAEHYCIASWGTAKSLAAAAGQGQFVGAMERALEEGHGQEFPFSATFERSPMRRKAVSTVPFQSIEEDAENKQEQLEKRGRGTVRRGRDN